MVATEQQPVQLLNLGLIDYQKAWDYQEKLCAENVTKKIEARKEIAFNETTHHLLLCEHPNVFTLGKSGLKENLLLNDKELKDKNAQFYKINRGGDITFHGPEQLVGYPILDLEKFFTDIHKYLRYLEEVIILTLADFSLKGERYEGYTGVWLNPENPIKARKICAMGVRCSRWITMHGFALNVNPDLSFFNNIIPCGIGDKQVTSMEKELGGKVNFNEVSNCLKHHFSKQFNAVFV